MSERKQYAWFSFYDGDFVRDTMDLTTEAVGAYVLLKIAYLAKCAPLRDDNTVLATITKLSRRAWLRHRPALETLFQVGGGFWRNSAFEAIIRERHENYAAKVKQTEPARKALAAKRGTGPSETASVTANLVGPAELVELIQSQRPSHAPNHNHTHTSPSSREKALQEFQLDERAKGVAANVGLSGSELDLEFSKFKRLCRAEIRSPADVFPAWEKWTVRWLEYVAKKTQQPAPLERETPANPTRNAYLRAVRLWLKDESKWPRRGFGPEPGQIGCQVPPDVFEELDVQYDTQLRRFLSVRVD